MLRKQKILSATASTIRSLGRCGVDRGHRAGTARSAELADRTVAITLIQGEEMFRGLNDYLAETFEKLRPHSIDAILKTVHPETEEKLKGMLSRSDRDTLSRRNITHNK